MKYLIICCISGLSLSLSFAQTITISDQESGFPIEGVLINSAQSTELVITDEQGQASLTAFIGDSLLELRTIGYEARQLSYTELEAAAFMISLTAMPLKLSEVVVSASRWPRRSHEVAVSIHSISPQEIALHQPQTAADLLGISGQVFIQKSQQGGGSPMIRGFAANRLLYAVDGVRMNTAIFRGGNLQNVINLDPFATERTEVRLGPGSVLYGSDAIGGAMSFQTLTPRLRQGEKPSVSGKAVVRYASANQEQTGHFNFNWGSKRWAVLSSFTSWNFDHLRQGSHGPNEYLKTYYVERRNGQDIIVAQDDPLIQRPSAYSQLNMMQKLRYKANAHWNLQYAFHYSETSPYGRYDRHNRRLNSTARYAEWDYGPQSWNMHLFTIEHDSTTSLYDRLSIRLARQVFGESRLTRNLNDPLREIQTEAVTAWSANVDLTKGLARGHQLYYGLEFIQNGVRSEGEAVDIIMPTTTTAPSRYPLARWYSLAAYGLYVYQPTERLGAEAGLRYNYISLDADFSNNLPFYPLPFTSETLATGAWTGSLGMHYHPTSKWVARANLSTAFRAPNVDDMGKVFDSEPGAVVVPNPDLEAEYAYTADLSLSRLLGQHLTLEVGAYYTCLQNALVRRPFLLNGLDSIVYTGTLSQVQAIQNAAQAQVYGGQIRLRLQLASTFHFSTDLNYQKGTEELEDGTSSPSRHAVPFFGVSRLTYRTHGLQLQAYLHFQGQRSHENLALEERTKTEIYALDADGNTYAPAWHTLNFKARYVLNNGLGFTLGLENITDQRYRPYSSGISGAGRQVVLAVAFDF